jgi:hypothetical protein
VTRGLPQTAAPDGRKQVAAMRERMKGIQAAMAAQKAKA